MTEEYCDVLILSAGFGGGHNQVARALTQALQMQDPTLQVVTVDYCDLLVPLVIRLTQFGYMQSIRHFPAGYGLYYQATGKISPDSFWQRQLNRMGSSELSALVEQLNPRVIVATFPLPAGVLSKLKESGRLNQPIITVITDYSVHSQWIHPYTDLYLVGSSQVADGLVERGVDPVKVAVTGIPILPAFGREYDRDQVKAGYGLSPSDQLVVFMGGSDGIFGNVRFHHILSVLPPEIKALVITGSNQELYEKLVLSEGKHPRLKVVRQLENVAAVMTAADLLVTKAGGVTISEALAKALPMVIYRPTPGQETANAYYLWRRRAAIIAYEEARLSSAVQRMMIDARFYRRIQQHCVKLGKPNAAGHGAHIIISIVRPPNRLFGYYGAGRRWEIRA